MVVLSAGDRKRLGELTRKGKSPAKKQLKARILLAADESPLGPKWNDPKISQALVTYPIMCARVRQQFAQGGIDAVLNRKQRATPSLMARKRPSSSPWPARSLSKAGRNGRCACW